MKTIFLCSLLCLALALTAAAADVSGKWSGTFTPENGDGDSAYVIVKQAGSTITGTGGPDANDQWPGLQGKIDGNKVTFTVTSAADGTVFKCTMVLDGDHLNGDIEFTAPDGGSGKAKMNLTRVTQ